MVDEILTESDPEYHWTDTFRTSRASNEASQRLLQQMSCRLRREMGRKVEEMGGNVVFGFRECFDLEAGTRTITVRGIGTAAFVFDPDEEEPPLASPRSAPASGAVDLLTVTSLPAGCVTALGGVVSARAIKLISEAGADHPDALAAGASGEENVREAWLNELREDIRSHARLLNCNAVLGYREEIRVQGDMYLLSAEATACRVDYAPAMPTSDDDEDEEYAAKDDEDNEEGEIEPLIKDSRYSKRRRPCAAMHVPYRRRRAPYPVELTLCRLCRRRYVPDLILATVEPPPELIPAGEPVLVDAFVVKPLRSRQVPAAAISSAMPFVEYDLHRQLLYKLRLRGYNALFGLRYSIAVNGSAIVAVASGTAVLLLGLAPPEPLRITRDLEVRDEEDRWLVEVQRRIVADAAANHETVEELLLAHRAHDLDLDDAASVSSSSTDSSSSSSSSETNSDEEEQEDRQRLAVVEIDDETDEDLVLCLLEPSFGSDAHFLAGNLEGPPPLDLSLPADSKPIPQLITVFRKLRLNLEERHLPFQLAQTVQSMYREAYLQARLAFASGPLTLRTVRHQIALSRTGDDLLLLVTGLASGRMQQPTQAEDADLAHRQQEWDELISLDVSTSSSSSSDAESDGDGERIFSRRHHLHIPDQPTQRDNHMVTSPGGKIQKFLIAGHMNHVELTPAAQVPSSAIVAHHGAISLTLFKELHLVDVPGGSAAAFTHDLLLEAAAILRANVISLEGNALVNLQIRPAAFLDSLKNQIGGILHLTGDVLEVEMDEPDAWSMLARKAFYPQT